MRTYWSLIQRQRLCDKSPMNFTLAYSNYSLTMRNLILTILESVCHPYLQQALDNTLKEQHTRINAQYQSHMESLTDFCLERFPAKDWLSVDFVRGLNRAMFPPSYKQEIATREGNTVWLVPGEFRTVSNRLCEFVATPEVAAATEQLVLALNATLFSADDEEQKHTAILKFHLDFLTVRPFFDANGRVASTIVDLLAIQEGLPPYHLHSTAHAMSLPAMKHRQLLATRAVKVTQKFGPRNVDVFGSTFVVSEEVFNPKFFQTSEFMAKNICVTAESSVLDIGTGSGIQAIMAGRVARNVVAVDINPVAVQCARENVKRNHLVNRVEVLEGDLFSSLPKDARFDLILFTPPYFESELSQLIDHALNDPGKILAKRFFTEARDHLKLGGYVQMLYTSLAQPELVLAMAEELGWDHHVIAEKKAMFENYFIYKLVPQRTF